MDIFSTDRERQAVTDQLTASMLAGMRARGMDLAGPVAVSTRLSFSSRPQALRAGADLVVGGWPGVRFRLGRTAEQSPSIELLYEMVLTVASIRDVRQQVARFAAERQAAVLGDDFGGESPFARASWSGPNQMQWEEELEREDQAVVERLSAMGVDQQVRPLVTAGIGFSSERQARGAAADLFLSGWPEVHVVQGGPRWVVEAVTEIVVGLETVRETRRNLTRLAAVRGGWWFGFSTAPEGGR